MATYDADLVPAPQPDHAGRPALGPARLASLSSIGAAHHLLLPHEPAAPRAPTTDAGSIPVGAVVERVT